MASGPFGRDRQDPLEFLPRATRFSGDPDLVDPVQIVRYIQAQPMVLLAIQRGFGLVHDPDDPNDDPSQWLNPLMGRPRAPGNWPLLFLAFVLSRTSSIQAFVSLNGSSQLWTECGFDKPPALQTVYDRFGELEKYVAAPSNGNPRRPDGFLRAATALIAKARTHEPQIGRSVNVDGTAIATHAALVHSCPASTACGRRQEAQAKQRAQRSLPRAAPKKAGHGTRVQSAPIEVINAARHQETEQAAPETGDRTRSPNALVALDDAAVKALGLDPELRWWKQKDKKNVWHYHCSLDNTAGMRRYTGKNGGKGKSWLGWNALKAVDSYTGAPLAIQLIAADAQEYAHYEALIDHVHVTTGHQPQHMTGDRGLAIKDVYRVNSERGIGSVLPWRQTTHIKQRRELENDTVDRHGVPRCKHCGAETHAKGTGLVVLSACADGRGG